MNAALIALADHFGQMKAGIVRDALQTHRTLVQLTNDGAASSEAIRALTATGIFDGAYLPGVRAIAKMAQSIA